MIFDIKHHEPDSENRRAAGLIVFIQRVKG